MIHIALQLTVLGIIVGRLLLVIAYKLLLNSPNLIVLLKINILKLEIVRLEKHIVQHSYTIIIKKILS